MSSPLTQPVRTDISHFPDIGVHWNQVRNTRERATRLTVVRMINSSVLIQPSVTRVRDRARAPWAQALVRVDKVIRISLKRTTPWTFSAVRTAEGLPYSKASIAFVVVAALATNNALK